MSPTECRQAEFLSRYGKDWVKHWCEDHPVGYQVQPFNPKPHRIIRTGLKALVSLDEPLESIKSDKHPLFVHGYRTVDLDGWVLKAKVTAMGVPAEHLSTAGTFSVVGTLRESPSGYQFSVREILTTKPMGKVK